MTSLSRPHRAHWSSLQDQYLLARPDMTDKALGVVLQRSAEAVKKRRHRLSMGIVGPKERSAEAIAKFQATMLARAEETAAGIEMRRGWPAPGALSWDDLLKGRTFGAPSTPTTAPVVMRRPLGYQGSLVGNGTILCGE